MKLQNPMAKKKALFIMRQISISLFAICIFLGTQMLIYKKLGVDLAVLIHP